MFIPVQSLHISTFASPSVCLFTCQQAALAPAAYCVQEDASCQTGSALFCCPPAINPSALQIPSVLPRAQCPCWLESERSSSVSCRYGHGFEMFCLASDSARTVVASACKVGVMNVKGTEHVQRGVFARKGESVT